MGPWRPVLVGVIALVAIAAAGTAAASSWVVLPPFVAAVAVLVTAAMRVDYFGLRRRTTDWHGQVATGRAAWARMRALEEQFARERRAGSVTTATTARALLIAQAELDALGRARELVDFLATDATTRVRRDPCADALRALALAEAARIDRDLDDVAGLPVVAWARARIAARGGAATRGLDAIERAEASPGSAVAHDLAALRARLLLRLGRADDAHRALCALAATARPWVERLASDRDAAVGLAARQALDLGAAYR